MKAYTHLWQYIAEIFLEWEMLHTKFVEKIKIQFYIRYNVFSSKIVPFMS